MTIGCTSSNQIASFYKFDAAWYESAMGYKTTYTTQQQTAYQNGNVEQQLQGSANQYQQTINTNYKQNGNVNYREQNGNGFQHIQSNFQGSPSQTVSVSGQQGFHQVVGGHVHTGGQCPCVKGKK